jgi:ubiquinone/menaquinone biosynthesis C-methylase UbiE
MTDLRGAIAGVFDRASETYDQLGVEFFGPIGRSLVELAGVHPGDAVLDVGCGRGAVLFPAADAAGPTGTVLGIDLAPGMVRRTGADAEQRGLTWVRVEQQDAQEPDLPAATYDVVLSSLVAFFLPDPGAGVTAWREAARDDARLAITTFAARDDPRWEWLEDLFPDRDPRATTMGGGDEKTSPFATDDALHELLAAGGWTDARSETREQVTTFREPADWLPFSWSVGTRIYWERTPEERRPEIERQALEHLTRMAGEPGGLESRSHVRYTTAVAS